MSTVHRSPYTLFPPCTLARVRGLNDPCGVSGRKNLPRGVLMSFITPLALADNLPASAAESTRNGWAVGVPFDFSRVKAQGFTAPHMRHHVSGSPDSASLNSPDTGRRWVCRSAGHTQRQG